MAQIFHPSTNTLSRLSIFGVVFVLAALLWLLAAYAGVRFLLFFLKKF